MSYQLYSVIVDPDKCVGCGACDKACPAVVFSIENKKAVASLPEQCWGPICESCLDECPKGAISIQPCFKKAGKEQNKAEGWEWAK